MLCQRQLFELGHPTQYNGKNNSFLFEKLFYSCLGKFRGHMCRSPRLIPLQTSLLLSEKVANDQDKGRMMLIVSPSSP